MKDVSAGRSDNARKKRRKGRHRSQKRRMCLPEEVIRQAKKEEKADTEAKNEGCVCRGRK